MAAWRRRADPDDEAQAQADRPEVRLRDRGAVRKLSLVAVTDHAAERYRQRVRGSLEERTEIAGRVARAQRAGRTEPGPRGTILVRDLDDPALVFVCRAGHDELVVISLWQEGDDAAVPKRFTDALRRDDHRVG